MKFERQNYTGLQSHFNKFFYSVCQSVSQSMTLICLNILLGLTFVCLLVPANIKKKFTCVAFYFRWGFGGGRHVGLSLDLSFGGW